MPDSETFNHATCPFCALACDDLRIASNGNRLTLSDDLPMFCRSSYEKAFRVSTAIPRYKGKEITLADAINKASEMLKQAKHPLFGGLITDIQGMRALLPLARRCNAVLDHADSDKTLRNLTVLQSHGIVGTTLSEIRRRADLLVFIGEGMFNDYPRLLQRICQTKLKNPKPEAKSILVGHWRSKDIPDILKKHCDIIAVPSNEFPTFIQKLGMLIHKRPNNQNMQAADTDTAYKVLVDDLERAEYPVFIWSSKDMNYPHADIGISLLSRLIKKINLKKRCVGLMLSGNRGAGNMQSVCLWQSGYPGYLSFNSEQTYYNPLHNRTAELLNRRRTDLLVWISAIHPEPPPQSDVPTIAFVHPMIAAEINSDLVVPVGVPGVDHAGYTYRTDGVVILPLPKLRNSTFPPLHEILHAIHTD